MKIDKSRFAQLALAIATATATTTACSAGADADDPGTSTENIEAGRACTDGSLRRPGEGSMTPYALEEGFCSELATSIGAPDAGGITLHFFDFIYSHCKSYSAQLQPAVAKKVYTCLKAAEDARPRDADGFATEEFDARVMYDCGKNALESICDQGIDGRVRTRAERMATKLIEQGDRRARAVIVNEVAAVLSGFKSPARKELEECVSTEDFGLYSCVESVGWSFADADPSEPRPTGAEACLSPDVGGGPPADACARVVAKAESENPDHDFTIDFVRTKCEAYVTKFKPTAAADAINCLLDPAKDTYQYGYRCGEVALKSTCRDDARVDGVCKGIVEAVTNVDPNANRGGRLMRECRALLPGLTDPAVREVSECVPGLAQDFGGSMARYALFSCIEGLEGL